ncbi:MAG TPA: hypothetical protein VG056_14835 [Pirellulales bacterium]|nr:hypothetical protein [Pirellulales bacterium]
MKRSIGTPLALFGLLLAVAMICKTSAQAPSAAPTIDPTTPAAAAPAPLAAFRGGGAFGNSGSSGIEQKNAVDSGPIFMATSKSGRTLYGYSVRTGTWDKVRLDSPAKEFAPNLAGSTGFVVLGKRVYAFSGIVGRWDSVEVADSKEPPVPTLDSDDRVRFDIGTKTYMFSAITGRWAVADLSVDSD